MRFSYRDSKTLLSGRMSDVLSSDIPDGPEDAGANSLGLNGMNREAIGVPIPQLQHHSLRAKNNTPIIQKGNNRRR